jgi:2-polyprenyl-6-methoxyphenol hydroxylase-like FAD-dependent oxidoreductase
MPNPEVLIVGAGPTGLVLALWLNRLGVRVRIIDKLPEPGTTSRALVMHARTLEFYRQIGLAETVVERGVKFMAANFWVKGRHVGRAAFGAMGQGLSPYPYMLVYPQDEHERLLIDRLAKEGVTVERPTELITFAAEGDRVVARLRLADGKEEACDSAYIAGCDGARSTVRNVLAAGFPGGTYARVFYVADVAAAGPVMNGELHVALDQADLLAVFPFKQPGHARFVGTVREEVLDKRDALAWEDVSSVVISHLGIKVEHVNWFSTYYVHHRVADRFRRGRAFLLGDAAHIHSPVGGQGMNTGIGDAVNLAWKLAAVLQGCATPELLDSYQPERIAFARRLVASTDRAFTIVSSPGPVARIVRTAIIPRVLPILFKSRTFRRFMFRTVSQINVNYRHSELSEGAAGRLKAGDRLPWVPFEGPAGAGVDNFVPLAALNWQVHVYGDAAQSLADFCRTRGLNLHSFPWQESAARAGLQREAFYLVRPDGYIALTDLTANVEAIDAYLQKHAVIVSA